MTSNTCEEEKQYTPVHKNHINFKEAEADCEQQC